MAEGSLSPTLQTNKNGKVKKSPYTYWVQGLSSVDQWNMFADKGWHKIDLDEGRAPYFSRYRRSCKQPLVKLAQIRPFPYATCLSHCCDKKQFYASMTAAGYSRSVPETYTSYEALRKSLTRDSPSAGEVWYVKTSDGCHGRGVQVFDDFRELRSHVRSLHNEPYVIQRGVSQLNLVDGKKWTIRTHVLITPELKLYAYNDGVCIIHSEEYKEGSIERAAQILHNSKATRFSLMRGPVAHLMPVVMPQVLKISFEVCNGIRTRLYRATNGAAYPPQPPYYYALMGLDFILDSSNVVHCLEVNEFPQLDFTNDPEAHEVVVNTFRDFLNLVVFPRASSSCTVKPRTGGWRLLPRQLDFSQEEAPSPPPCLQDIKKKQQPLPHSTDAEKKMFQEKERAMESPAKARGRVASPREEEVRERVTSPPISPLPAKGTPPVSPTPQRARLENDEGKDVPPIQDKRRLPAAVPSPPVSQGSVHKMHKKRQVLKMHRVGVRVAGHPHGQAVHPGNNEIRHASHSQRASYYPNQPGTWANNGYTQTLTRSMTVLHSIENGGSVKIRRPLRYTH